MGLDQMVLKNMFCHTNMSASSRLAKCVDEWRADVPMKIGRGNAQGTAGQSAGQRGTADVPIKMGRGNLTPFGVLKV